MKPAARPMESLKAKAQFSGSVNILPSADALPSQRRRVRTGLLLTLLLAAVCLPIPSKFIFSPAISADVTFEVSIPGQKDQSPPIRELFISGSHPALGNWHPGKVPLKPADPSRQVWKAVVDIPRGITIEYKYTLGSWESVEWSGIDEIPNRKVKWSENLIVRDKVAAWKISGLASAFPYGKSLPRMFERVPRENTGSPIFLSESRDLPDDMAQGRKALSGPFLSFRDSTSFSREVAITFVLPARGVVVVALGTSPGARDLGVFESRPRRLHTLVLGKLKPEVEYHYEVRDPSGAALAPPASFTLSRGKEFSFAAIGDCRTGSKTDVGKTIASILHSRGKQPDLLFFLGDQTPGGRLEEWLDFMEIWSPICSRIPSLVISGNHDYDSGVEWQSMLLPMPHDPPNTGHFFTLTAGKHRFICLDGGNFEKSIDFRSGQKDFLQYEIIRAFKEKEKGIINWVIPVIHDSLVTVGSHAVCEDVLSLRNEILGLFRAGGLRPDLVLTSHDHNLQLNDLDGVPFIVSGSAGAPMTNALYDPDGLGVFYASQRGYAWIDAQVWKMDCELVGLAGSIGKCTILSGQPPSTDPATINIDGELDDSYGPKHLWEDRYSSLDARLYENGLAVRLGGAVGSSSITRPVTWVVALCRPVRGSGPAMLLLPSFLPAEERILPPSGGVVAFAMVSGDGPGTLVPRFYALNNGGGVNFSISRLQVSRQETWAANSGDGFELRFPLSVVTKFFHTPGTKPGSVPLPGEISVTAWSLSGSDLKAVSERFPEGDPPARITLAAPRVKPTTSFSVRCLDPEITSMEIRVSGSGLKIPLSCDSPGIWRGHTDSIDPETFSFTLFSNGLQREKVDDVYGLRGIRTDPTVRVSKGGRTTSFEAGPFR